MVSDGNVGGDAGCARVDGGDADADLGGGFAVVEIDVFAVGVDGFAGVNGEPVAVAVEAALQCEGEVGSAGNHCGEGIAGGLGGDFHPVVDGGKGAAGVLNQVGEVVLGGNCFGGHDYLLPFLGFLAVLAAALKAAAVGAPFVPGLRIFSPDPAAMRLRLAAMLAYKPGFLVITFS